MNKRLLPAYPLFVKDPYFSFWADSEQLNDSDVIFWSGMKKKFYGVLKIDGKPYEYMGNYGGIAKAEQTKLSVSSYTTDYEFKIEDVTLKLSFVSPLPLDDMDTLSCPVAYMNYEIISDKKHDYEITLFINENICYNNDDHRSFSDKGVVGCVFKLNGFEAARIGLNRQAPLSAAEDDVCAEWGYYYITGENAYITHKYGVRDYLAGLIKSEELPFTTTELQQSGWNVDKYIMSVNKAEKGKIMLAFDDIAAARYYGKYLYDYYYRNGKTIVDAMNETFANSEKTDKHLAMLDADLKKKAGKYGEEYLNVLYASLRQSIAMHKLCLDTEGNVLFMSREADSNSCIATVDVSYPSVPLYLLYDTEYVKGMMRPIFKFAGMPVWTYDFAPHDGGTYPNCDGQVYGAEEGEVNNSRYHATSNAWTAKQYRTRPDYYMYPANSDVFVFEKQMPVEECANMIIMCEACYHKDGKKDFLAENADLLEKWVVYLEKYGLIPANQLCTDDFAGHLDKNINLAIKATVGIGCYAEICKALGNETGYKHYRETAEKFAREIENFAAKYKWCPITWDTDDSTFSLKYNLAFDKILKLGLFDKKFYETEVKSYIPKCNKYGVPLDSRKNYSKSDWLMWTASLAYEKDDATVFIKALDRYLRETVSRIPFSDWYETVTGEYRGFIARSVQGGNFILLLND